MAEEKKDPFAEKEPDKEKELTHDEASHYLVLADGRHIPYNVGNEPYQVMPTEYDGMRVDRVVSAH